MRFNDANFRAYHNLLWRYNLAADSRCTGVLRDNFESPVGYECKWSGGGTFAQMGAMPYQAYNSNDYAVISDSGSRMQLLRHFVTQAKIKSKLELPIDTDRNVAVSRTDGNSLWITTKTGSPLGADYRLKVNGMRAEGSYTIKDLLGDSVTTITGKTLAEVGFSVKLPPNGSTVYFVEPLIKP